MFSSAINSFLVIMLAISSLTDISANKIPNFLTLPCTLAGMAYHTLAAGMDGLLFSLTGCVTGGGLLILPYCMNSMGAGDVKLMGAVGSFLGAKATLEAFIFIALVGGVYSLLLILIRRDVFGGFFSEKMMVLSSMVMLRQYVPIQMKNSGPKARLKYGVAIAFGTITHLFLKSLGFKILA